MATHPVGPQRCPSRWDFPAEALGSNPCPGIIYFFWVVCKSFLLHSLQLLCNPLNRGGEEEYQ